MLKLKLADYSSDSLSVYLVNGQYIRDEIFIDFTEGGNWLRYDFIPSNEIWIGGVHIIEAKYILVHELAEVCYALSDGLDIRNESDYTKAHEHANEVESSVRVAPNTIDDILTNLYEEFEKVTESAQGSYQEDVIWQR